MQFKTRYAASHELKLTFAGRKKCRYHAQYLFIKLLTLVYTCSLLLLSSTRRQRMDLFGLRNKLPPVSLLYRYPEMGAILNFLVNQYR